MSPEIDKSTDWFLLHGEESNMQTILRFVRKLDTCDPEDKVIDVSSCHRLTIVFMHFNPQLSNGPVHPYQLDESISNFRGVWCTFSFLFYFEYISLLANREEPDLGLHCLPTSMGQ